MFTHRIINIKLLEPHVYEQNIHIYLLLRLECHSHIKSNNNIRLNKLISKFYRSFYVNSHVIDNRSNKIE